MDPNACLARFLDALRDGDLEEATYAADDLTNWINQGGFLPTAWEKAGITRYSASALLTVFGLQLGHHATTKQV